MFLQHLLIDLLLIPVALTASFIESKVLINLPSEVNWLTDFFCLLFAFIFSITSKGLRTPNLVVLNFSLFSSEQVCPLKV